MPVDVEGQEPRRPVDVAVGVLIDAEGRFLLTSRPQGKVYAGYWEFPGGKLEAGETVEQALRRELHEEIGITIGAVQPWQDRADGLPARPRAPALLQGLRVAGRVRDARAAGHGLADAAGAGACRCCPARCRCCDWFAQEQGFAGATHLTPEPRYTGPMNWLDEVKWDAQGLVPVIAQEVGSNDVLMFAFMNREALQRTAELGRGRLLEPLAPPPVAQGRGVRPHPEGA